MAGALPMNALTRAWSLLMKGLAETQAAPDAVAAGEIALIRLAFAADLPTPDEALKMLSGETAPPVAPRAPRQPSRGGPAPQAALSEPDAVYQAASPAPAGPRLESFLDVVRLAGEKRDARLKVELESYVHLIGFETGRIELRLDERAPSDLAGRLMQRLKEWTGRQWVVSINAQETGGDTLRDARTADVLAHPLVRKALEVFPGAEIVAIRDPAPQGEPAAEDHETEGE
jgi:DNA polymerase-3 subunit gamma/tau